MAKPVQIELLPLGKTLTLEPGERLQDALFAQGVEFPCGGRGRCKGCKVKVLAGALPVSAEDERLLKPAELAAGWRLSCRARAEGDLRIELAQWEATILADDSVFEFTPQDGLGIAVDLGTTTIVAQLLDLRAGHVLAVRTGLNAQARHNWYCFVVAGVSAKQSCFCIGRKIAELTSPIGLLNKKVPICNAIVCLPACLMYPKTVLRHIVLGLLCGRQSPITSERKDTSSFWMNFHMQPSLIQQCFLPCNMPGINFFSTPT